jgi:hypothetical protein
MQIKPRGEHHYPPIVSAISGRSADCVSRSPRESSRRPEERPGAEGEADYPDIRSPGRYLRPGPRPRLNRPRNGCNRSRGRLRTSKTGRRLDHPVAPARGGGATGAGARQQCWPARPTLDRTRAQSALRHAQRQSPAAPGHASQASAAGFVKSGSGGALRRLFAASPAGGTPRSPVK